MGTLTFSRGDVHANRAGHISPAQRARILENMAHLRDETRAHLTEATFVATSAIALALLANATGLTLLLCIVTCGTGWALFAWLDGARLRRLQADVEQGTVGRREGPLCPVAWLDRAGIKRYGIDIDGHRYRLPHHIFVQIEAGQSYRVYYGRHSGDLLSMETISTTSKGQA